MMRTSLLRAAAYALSLGLIAPVAAASASQPMMVLGSGGELYRLRTGTYGQLFSAGLIPADHSVLALEIRRPGSPHATRLLVPGTDGNDRELAPSLRFEESSGTVIVVWSSQWNYIHSRINLALYADDRWSQTIELSGDVWSRKSSPAVAVTRDTYMTSGENGPVTHQRTIYNVVWWEEAGVGDRVAYSPVVFVDGSYIGWNPVFLLTDLPNLEPDPLAAPNDPLLEAPSIQAGRTDAEAVAAFIHPSSGRLVTMELAAVAGELAYLADEVTADLLDFAGSNTSATGPALSERARAQMVDFGLRIGLHPGVVDYLSRQIETELQGDGTTGATPIASLIERARAQMVDFGVRMSAQGLGGQADSSPAWLAEFPSSETDPGRGPLHGVRLRQVEAYPAPVVGAAPAMLVSAGGHDVIVFWSTPQEVTYIESLPGGSWSERRSLTLGPQLTVEQALEVLAARVRSR